MRISNFDGTEFRLIRRADFRGITDDLGGIQSVMFFGGGSSGGESHTTTTPGTPVTQYIQSPEQEQLYKMLIPVMKNIFPHGEATTNLYDIPDLSLTLPELAGAKPETDVSKYTVGSDAYQAVSDKIAPTLWNAYDRNVENPLINRFANSGSLGSAMGGLSGAAADALENSRTKAGDAINSQIFQYAQTPLNTAMAQDFQNAMAQYAAENAMSVNRATTANQQASDVWKANIEKLQYPFQILPGMLGGSMPTPFVSQGPSSSTTTTSGGGK